MAIETTYNDDAIAVHIAALIIHLTGWRKRLVINVTREEVVLLELVLYGLKYVVRKRKLELIFVSSSWYGIWTLEQSLGDFKEICIACVGTVAVDGACNNSAAVSILPEQMGAKEAFAYLV